MSINILNEDSSPPIYNPNVVSQPANPPQPSVLNPQPVSGTYQNPLPSPSQNYTSSNLNQTPPSKRFDKKILFVILAIIILLLVVIFAFFVLNQKPKLSQETTAKVLPSNTLMATFDGENIYYKDLVAVASEQYVANAINNQALKDALNILAERKVLDKEKIDKNIEVSEDEKKQKQDQDGVTSTQAYYGVLKEKTTKIEAKSFEVYVIGFWVPPASDQGNLTEAEKATIQTQLSEGIKAMDEAEQLLKTDQAPLDIASGIVSKYQSLSPILGVNGYLLTQAKESGELSNLTTPKVYTFDPTKEGQPLYDIIYSLKTPGEVKKADSNDSSGANVVKLVSSNSDTGFDSYDEWLLDKKKTLLHIVYSL